MFSRTRRRKDSLENGSAESALLTAASSLCYFIQYECGLCSKSHWTVKQSCATSELHQLTPVIDFKLAVLQVHLTFLQLQVQYEMTEPRNVQLN